MNDNHTKQKILDTMCNLIAQKGYDKTSIGQIADAIGIKKASVYYYFKSKEEIFLQLVRDIYEDDYLKKPLLLDKDSDIGSFQRELYSFGNALIDSYFENPNLRKVYAEIDLQTTRIPALKEFCAQQSENMNKFLYKCMTRGVAIGAFPPQFDAQVNAHMLYAIIIGIDAAILYDLCIDPKAVWREAILKLFAGKEISCNERNTVCNTSN